MKGTPEVKVKLGLELGYLNGQIHAQGEGGSAVTLAKGPPCHVLLPPTYPGVIFLFSGHEKQAWAETWFPPSYRARLQFTPAASTLLPCAVTKECSWKGQRAPPPGPGRDADALRHGVRRWGFRPGLRPVQPAFRFPLHVSNSRLTVGRFLSDSKPVSSSVKPHIATEFGMHS